MPDDLLLGTAKSGQAEDGVQDGKRGAGYDLVSGLRTEAMAGIGTWRSALKLGEGPS